MGPWQRDRAWPCTWPAPVPLPATPMLTSNHLLTEEGTGFGLLVRLQGKRGVTTATRGAQLPSWVWGERLPSQRQVSHSPGNPHSSRMASGRGCGDPLPARGATGRRGCGPQCSLGIPGMQSYFWDLLGSPYREQRGCSHGHLSSLIEFLLEARGGCGASSDTVSHDPALSFQPALPPPPPHSPTLRPGLRQHPQHPQPWALARSRPGHRHGPFLGHVPRGPCDAATPPSPHLLLSAHLWEASPRSHLQRLFSNPDGPGTSSPARSPQHTAQGAWHMARSTRRTTRGSMWDLTIEAMSAASLPWGVTTSCSRSPQKLLDGPGTPICSVPDARHAPSRWPPSPAAYQLPSGNPALLIGNRHVLPNLAKALLAKSWGLTVGLKSG